MFEKENDPTVLRAPSAGKLIQYTVEDGGHVEAGSSYADMEVSTESALRLGLQPGLPFTPLPKGEPFRIAPAPLHPGPAGLTSPLGHHLPIPQRAPIICSIQRENLESVYLRGSEEGRIDNNHGRDLKSCKATFNTVLATWQVLL